MLNVTARLLRNGWFYIPPSNSESFIIVFWQTSEKNASVFRTPENYSKTNTKLLQPSISYISLANVACHHHRYFNPTQQFVVMYDIFRFKYSSRNIVTVPIYRWKHPISSTISPSIRTTKSPYTDSTHFVIPHTILLTHSSASASALLCRSIFTCVTASMSLSKNHDETSYFVRCSSLAYVSHLNVSDVFHFNSKHRIEWKKESGEKKFYWILTTTKGKSMWPTTTKKKTTQKIKKRNIYAKAK